MRKLIRRLAIAFLVAQVFGLFENVQTHKVAQRRNSMMDQENMAIVAPVESFESKDMLHESDGDSLNIKLSSVELKELGTKFVQVNLQRVGDAIRSARLELNLTQKQLADRVGKSTATICKIESGQHPLDYKTLNDLAVALNVSSLRIIWSLQRANLEKSIEGQNLIKIFETVLAGVEAVSKRSIST
jgi:transcriptional regulator with XRE-family HTH domain